MNDYSTIQLINEFCLKIHDLVQQVCDNPILYYYDTLLVIDPASLNATITGIKPLGCDAYPISTLIYDNYPNYEAINTLASQYILLR